MKKNKMLLVMISGVLSFSAMPSVYASNSTETSTSEKQNVIQNNSDSISGDNTASSENSTSLQTQSDTEAVLESNTNSSSEDSAEKHGTTINDSDDEIGVSESTTEDTVKSNSTEKTPEEKAVEETLANLPKMELRPELGPGYYEVEGSGSKVRSKRSLMTSTAMSNSELFLSKIKAGAISGWKKYKVLPSLTGAQAVLESGWGSSGLSQSANNLFGIKGRYNGKFELWPTLEYINGQWVTVNAEFRKYPSWKESMEDHGKFLVENPRYYKVLGEKNYIKATNEIWLAGYATDPDYPGKLQRTITYNNLTAWDKEAFGDNINLNNYYTTNPSTVVTKKADYSYSGVEFTTGNRVKSYPQGTVFKVSGIIKSKNGTPRLKLSNGKYFTAHKNNVIKTINSVGNYYTINPGTIITKKEDWSHTSVNFTEKNKVKKYPVGSVLKIANVSYTANGSPRFKLKDGTYFTNHKTNVMPTISTAGNYYTINPGIIITKKEDWSHTSVNFTEKNKVKKYPVGSVLKIANVSYTANGSPRFKLKDGTYFTSHKTNVMRTISTIGNYYITNLGTVITKKEDWSHTSVNFTEKNKVKKYPVGSVLKIADVSYTANGSPRFKLKDGTYFTSHKTNVMRTINTAGNYYTSNPNIVVTKEEDWSHSSVNFTEANKVKKYKIGTVLKVKKIVFTANGSPRMQLEDNSYYTAHKSNVIKTIAKITDYYTINPDTIITKNEDWSHTSVNFTEANKVKKYPSGSVLKIANVSYTANGSPRFKLKDGTYFTSHKTNVMPTINTAGNYYTSNPNIVVTKEEDWSHSSFNFTEANKVQKYKIGTILKVKKIVFTANGSPRMQLEDNTYYTAHKSNVIKTIAKVADYYTVNPETIITKNENWSHTSVDFTEANKVKNYPIGTVLEVKEVSFTANGSPRFKLTDGTYFTSHKTNVGENN